MSTIINASTSSGLVQTADTSGTLELQSNGTTMLSVLSTGVKFPVYTVATLPTAGTAGRRAFVSNALTPVALSAVVGGGAVTVPVFDNGTSWMVG
jgi:hypothetical protein